MVPLDFNDYSCGEKELIRPRGLRGREASQAGP